MSYYMCINKEEWGGWRRSRVNLSHWAQTWERLSKKQNKNKDTFLEESAECSATEQPSFLFPPPTATLKRLSKKTDFIFDTVTEHIAHTRGAKRRRPPGGRQFSFLRCWQEPAAPLQRLEETRAPRPKIRKYHVWKRLIPAALISPAPSLFSVGFFFFFNFNASYESNLRSLVGKTNVRVIISQTDIQGKRCCAKRKKTSHRQKLCVCRMFEDLHFEGLLIKDFFLGARG